MARRRLTVVGLVAGALTAGPAYAATGSPPVTHPDTVTVHSGEGVFVDPTDNDGDPDGDSLQVCRLQPDLPRALRFSEVQDGDLFVAAGPRARGTFTITYYACDASSLTPGTITVVVKPPRPTIDVIPLDGRLPGLVKIKNTYERKTFRCTWREGDSDGDSEADSEADSDDVDGKVTVPAQSARIFRVRSTSLTVECHAPRVGVVVVFDAGRLVTATRR